MTERKYDVAFSFLNVDLPLAQQLEHALAPLRCFVYSTRQEEVVTRAGEDVFGPVFGTASTLNVILYRQGYGEQGWTAYEKQMITGRCRSLANWKSFALIRTDESAAPGWVPADYIYGTASHLSFEALVRLIHERAREAGVVIAPETPATRIARLASERQFEQETDLLATGGEAWSTVQSNWRTIHQDIATAINEHTSPEAGLTGEAGVQGSWFGANLGDIGCYLNFQCSFGRVTSCRLIIRFFNQVMAIPATGQYNFGVPAESVHYEANVIRSPALGWCAGLFRGSRKLRRRLLNSSSTNLCAAIGVPRARYPGTSIARARPPRRAG